MSPERRTRTVEDLRAEFNAQVSLLVKSCAEFDRGDVDEAKRLAVSLRILLYDGGRSRSLLKQLKLDDVLFFDTAEDVNRNNLLPTFGLTLAYMIGPQIGQAGYAPLFTGGSYGRPTWLIPFEYWWTKAVICVPGEFDLSRRDLVLTMTNQDGGAHVDGAIDENYYRLTREKLGAIKHVTEQGAWPLPHIEAMSIRQVAEEVRISLVRRYTMISPDLTPELTDEDWLIQYGCPRPKGPNGEALKELPNYCPCHSGLEYRHLPHEGRPERGQDRQADRPLSPIGGLRVTNRVTNRARAGERSSFTIQRYSGF